MVTIQRQGPQQDLHHLHVILSVNRGAELNRGRDFDEAAIPTAPKRPLHRQAPHRHPIDSTKKGGTKRGSWRDKSGGAVAASGARAVGEPC